MKTFLPIILLVLCLCGATQLHAQTDADSLRRLILPAADDTLKVRRLTELSRIFAVEGKYDSALATANWIKILAERLHDGKGQADALLGIGRVFELQSQYNIAMPYFQQSLTLAEKNGYKLGIANATNKMGRVFEYQSQYPQALKYYLAGLKVSEEIGDKVVIARALNSVGGLYQHQNQYPQALEYYFKSLQLSEKINDKRFIATGLNNVGFIYLSQKKYAQAIEYFRKSLYMRQELKFYLGIASTLNNIGKVFEETKQFDSAYIYYCRSDSVATQIKNLVQKSHAQYGITSTLIKQYKYIDALSHAQEVIKFSIETKSYKVLSETYALLATIHAALGNYKAAYAAQSEHYTLKDSLFNADNAKRITALQADYNAQKQAAEQKLRDTEARHKAELAAEEKERQTRFQYAAIAGVVLFVLALALASRRVSAGSIWGRRFGRFVSFSAVVMLVEFAILFLDPWLDRVTGGAPLWRMAANVCIAVVVTPLHGVVEARLRTTRRRNEAESP